MVDINVIILHDVIDIKAQIKYKNRSPRAIKQDKTVHTPEDLSIGISDRDEQQHDIDDCLYLCIHSL